MKKTRITQISTNSQNPDSWQFVRLVSVPILKRAAGKEINL